MKKTLKALTKQQTVTLPEIVMVKKLAHFDVIAASLNADHERPKVAIVTLGKSEGYHIGVLKSTKGTLTQKFMRAACEEYGITYDA